MKKIIIMSCALFVYMNACAMDQDIDESEKIVWFESEKIKKSSLEEEKKPTTHKLLEKNLNQNTVLHVAVNRGDRNAVKKIMNEAEEAKIIEDVLFAQDRDGNTPLGLAVVKGNEDIVEILLDVVEDEELEKRVLREKNLAGKTLLMIAAINGNKKNIEALLDLALTEDILAEVLLEQDSDGNTPLHIAQMMNKKEAVREILQTLEEEIKGVPAISGYRDIISKVLLAKNKNDKTPLDLAKTMNTRAVLQFAYKHGLDTNETNSNNQLPTDDEKAPVVRQFPSREVQQDSAITQELFALINQGDAQKVNAFFGKPGLNITDVFLAKNSDGLTPLEYAFYLKKRNVVDALIAILDKNKRARAMLKNSSILDAAIDSGDINMVFKGIKILGIYQLLKEGDVLDRAIAKANRSATEPIQSLLMGTKNMLSAKGKNYMQKLFKEFTLTLSDYQRNHVDNYLSTQSNS